eukprot:356475-Chlamydomonas_euryale.AAC.4
MKQWGALRPAALMRLPSPREQADLVWALEAACLEASSPGVHSPLLAIASNLLKWLYDADVLSEEGILAWHGGRANPAGRGFRDAVKALVEWLQEADDDDDEDDDEE